MKNKWLPIALILVVGAIAVIEARFVTDRSAAASSDTNKSTVAAQAARPASSAQDDGDALPPPVDLFTTDRDIHASWSSRTPAAARARAVVPDPALMKAQPVLKVGDRLTLPLFDDAILETVVSDVTTYPNGSVGMTAHLQGDHKGTVYLAYSGGELRMHADVLGGNDFYVRYDPEQEVHVAIEIDGAMSDYNGTCVEYPTDHAAGGSSEGGQTAAGTPSKIAYDAPASVVVDVMIVYTPAALSYEGSINGINNNIALAMQKANETHGNSETRVTLNLVHSAEVTYTEAETVDPVNGDPGDDLYNLTYTGVGYSAMDEVQDWRDTYKADLVCLYESTEMTGGLGWLLSSTSGQSDLAFCLARVEQADWTYTVVHEWGHNMGCSHSKSQAVQPWESDDLFSYSAGWQWSDTASSASSGYCSIMTYENHDGISGNGDEYERVPYFSNPDIAFAGNEVNPAGDATDGDNARTIRSTRQVVAEYRLVDSTFTLFPFGSDTNQYYQWETAAERHYSLYWSTGLPHGFSLLESNLTSGSYTDNVHAAAEAGFYKLEAQPAY